VKYNLRRWWDSGWSVDRGTADSYSSRAYSAGVDCVGNPGKVVPSTPATVSECCSLASSSGSLSLFGSVSIISYFIRLLFIQGLLNIAESHTSCLVHLWITTARFIISIFLFLPLPTTQFSDISARIKSISINTYFDLYFFHLLFIYC
jgi:hypothetical protein